MAYVNFTQLANILEKDIIPAVYVQLYQKAPMWETFSGFAAEESAGIRDRVNSTGIRFANNTIYVTTQNGRPQISGVRSLGGDKYGYGVTPTNQGSLSISTSVGSFIMPKAMMNAKAEGVIVDQMQFNINSTVDSMAMDLNRQCYGDGTGVLAFVAASGSSTTVTLKPKTGASTTYNNDIPLATRYFAIGMAIKVGSNAVCNVLTISGSNSITVDATQTLVAGTSIIKYTSTDNTTPVAMTAANGLSFLGLDVMVAAQDVVYMMTDATDATWASYNKDGDATASITTTTSGSPKTFAKGDLDDAFFTANVTGNVKLMWMNKTEFMKYGESLTDQVRFDVKLPLSGGWAGLNYMAGKANVVLDYDCPDDTIYFLSPEKLFHAEYQPLQFETGTMGQAMRVPQTLDFDVTADIMGNIGTFVRSANAVLTNRVG